ncbi:MAG: UDP-N-acetylmuramate dehydrogenase [Oscillospiraceae bacterium]
MLLDKFAALAEQLGCAVLRDEPLSKHTSFRIGGPCTVMVCPNSIEAAAKLVKYANENAVRTLILGKGSNMLCSDEGFDGAVILLDNNFSEVTLVGENTLRAQAGASLMKICRAALEHSLTGMEFAYGIPGTVGGGVYMNAGAYDGEMKNVVSSVTAVSPNGELITYSPDELDFGYRHSRFVDGGEIIVSADITLKKGDKDKIEARMNELMGRRKDKQPLEYPSAGSTFKRPEGLFAGRLIQDCGLKGASVGGAQVSEKHCGFVVNKGGATAADVISLVNMIKEQVFDKTGVTLECEIRIIPYKEN